MARHDSRKRRDLLSTHVKETPSGCFTVKAEMIHQEDVIEFVREHATRFGIAEVTAAEIAAILNLEVEFLRMHGLALPLVGDAPAFPDDHWGDGDVPL